MNKWGETPFSGGFPKADMNKADKAANIREDALLHSTHCTNGGAHTQSCINSFVLDFQKKILQKSPMMVSKAYDRNVSSQKDS